MEKPHFGPPNFESSDDSSESKEKPKKKSAESKRPVLEPSESEKKTEVAEKGKSLWERLVPHEAGADKTATPEASGTRSAETSTDQEENDPTLERLSGDEEAEVERTLVEQRLSELRAEQSDGDDPGALAEREAVIAYLEQQLEAVEPKGLEQEDAGSAIDVPEEPAEFEDDEPISLSGRSTAAPTASSLHGGGGRGTPPPSPPASLGPVGGGRGTVQPLPRTTSAGLNTAANPDGLHQPDYRVNPNATYLLVGGIVGYLIGRRRGRIKTEKRMRVVQAELEKQVEDKQQRLVESEQRVRRTARENYEQRTRRPEQAERPILQPSIEVPKTVEKIVPLVQSSKPEARAAQLSHSEASHSGVKELSQKEILTMSETISIGNTNLRKIYESRLISESGLRRLVYEHLEGHDIRRGLAREFLAKELSYERDPRMRDLIAADNAIRAAGAASPSDAATAVSMPRDLPTDTAASQAAAAHQSNLQSPKSRSQHVSNGVLVVLTLIALGLAVYAVLLGLTR